MEVTSTRPWPRANSSPQFYRLRTSIPRGETRGTRSPWRLAHRACFDREKGSFRRSSSNGAIGDLCALLKPGDPALMVPPNVAGKRRARRRCGRRGLGNAVLFFPRAAASAARGCSISPATRTDRPLQVEEIEVAATKSCGLHDAPAPANPPQDKAYVVNIGEAMAALRRARLEIPRSQAEPTASSPSAPTA